MGPAGAAADLPVVARASGDREMDRGRPWQLRIRDSRERALTQTPPGRGVRMAHGISGNGWDSCSARDRRCPRRRRAFLLARGEEPAAKPVPHLPDWISATLARAADPAGVAHAAQAHGGSGQQEFLWPRRIEAAKIADAAPAVALAGEGGRSAWEVPPIGVEP